MRFAARVVAAWAAAGALTLSIAACGGTDTPEATSNPPPPVKPQDFPSAKGKALDQLRAEVGRSGPVLAAAVSQFHPGENRYGFALFDLARAQIADAPVVLYTAPAGGGRVTGPIPASFEEMAVKPQFQSRTVANDPDAAKSIYVARLGLPKPGKYDVLAVARLDDRLVAARPAGGPVVVAANGPVPDVGDKAPVVHTETKTDVAGDLASIDTRTPPSSMHDVDFADVVGHKPVVLLFATAALCQSRVCGPVIDVAEQAKSEHAGDDVVFVHEEIYTDNDISKGYRPQVSAYGLPTEPWAFAIDRHGRVAARLEGAFSPAELNRAIAAAERG